MSSRLRKLGPFPRPRETQAPAPAGARTGVAVAARPGVQADVYQIETADRVLLLRRGERLGIGRDPKSDLVFAGDDTVSRRHARLDWVAFARPVVVDLGSANGTFLDGVRVLGRATLDERCALGIGRSLVMIELKHPALIASDPGPLLCRLAGDRWPEVEGELAGPAALQGLLLELAQTRRTATLWLEQVGRNALGRVTFAAGIVVDVQAPRSRGRDGLRELLLHAGATRYMVSAEVEPCDEPLALQVSDVIIDAMRASRAA